MPAMTVISDDLTGAMDAGGKLRAHWAGVEVWPANHWLKPDEPAAAAGAWVIDSGTRSRSWPEAKVRLEHLLDWLQARSIPVTYKKIDSTLRGHLAAELGLVLQREQCSVCLCPALPEQGRVVRQGVLELQQPGQPADAAVRVSAVADSLAGLPVTLVPQDSVDRLLSRTAAAPQIWVCDAQTEADLDRLAAAVLNRTDVLPCGSAGLLQALGRQSGTTVEPVWPPAQAASAEAKAVAVISCSQADVTRQQLQRLEQLGFSRLLWPEPDRLPTMAAGTRLGGDAARLVAAGQDVILDGCMRNGNLGCEAGAQIVDAMEHAAAALAAAAEHLAGLVVVGGDGLGAVCRALQVERIDVIGEVEPAMPAGILCGFPLIPVVTKAGGFGTTASLETAAQFLRQR